ncbi:hypothetical protein, partial [Nonomuraea sp. JJY05]|uniref:hypothetical protein n=1 Tax=Nonomuraea sp. JJY05 TaxID=3350255 RepID=UPI00373F981A
MTDEEEGDALLQEITDPVEQPADRCGVQLGRRLVEDDEASAERQRPGDLDERRCSMVRSPALVPALTSTDQLSSSSRARRRSVRQLISPARPRLYRLRNRFSACSLRSEIAFGGQGRGPLVDFPQVVAGSAASVAGAGRPSRA